MRVLSIDPGYERLGIAILEKNKNKESLIYSSCFQTDPNLEIKKRLLLLGTEIKKIIKKHSPDAVAIERLYFNKNHKTAMATAEAIGVILYEAAKSELDVKEYTPQEIKVAVTGYGKSDKRQVIDMVKILLKIKGKKALDDEFDAIAVGLTFFAQNPKS